MTTKLKFLFLLLLLNFSCSKNKKDENGPNFTIKIDSLSESEAGIQNAEVKKIFDKVKAGDSVEVLEVIKVLEQTYSKVNSANVNKDQIINDLKNSDIKKDEISEVKESLFNIYEKNHGELHYNKDSINIFDIDSEAKFQCSSGTWNIWSAFLKVNPRAINTKNLVNIYTSGHILAGEVIAENGVNVLYGYESTVLGKGLVRFGEIAKIAMPMRIVDLRYDLVLQSLNGSIRATDMIKEEVLNKTKNRFNFDLERLESYIVSDLFSNPVTAEIVQNKMNQSIFGFGDSNTSEGDLKLEKADEVISNSYFMSGPNPTGFTLKTSESTDGEKVPFLEFKNALFESLDVDKSSVEREKLEGYRVNPHPRVNTHVSLYDGFEEMISFSQISKSKDSMKNKIQFDKYAFYYTSLRFIDGKEEEIVNNALITEFRLTVNEAEPVYYILGVSELNSSIVKLSEKKYIVTTTGHHFYRRDEREEKSEESEKKLIYDFTKNPGVNPKKIITKDSVYEISVKDEAKSTVSGECPDCSDEK